MSQQAKHIYEFGPFRLEAAERLLQHNGEAVTLAPKAFDLLLVLVKNGGHLLEKEELMRLVWPDSFVEEANLSRNVFTLRKVLGEGADGPEYIETVPKRGYRFVARVTTVLDESNDLIVEERFKPHVLVKQTEETSVIDGVTEDAEPTKKQALTAQLRARRVPLRRHYQLVITAPVLLAGLAVALSYFGIERQRKQSQPSVIAKQLAVLPFKSIGTLGSDEDLLLGMADTLIIKLSNVKRIVVRPTNAVRRYIGQNQDSVAAGRELGVDAVLDGNIRRLGDRILVSVQLIAVGDGVTLLADKFEEKFTNIFTVEDLITERVAAALTLKLTGEERGQLAKRYTQNVEAYRLYMLGRYYSQKTTQAGWEKGIDYFKQAINKDQDYALAYLGLANCYHGLGWSGLLPLTEVRPKREAAVMKAIEIDNTLAEAHLALSSIKSDDWDWVAAENRLKLALDLNPNSADAHHAYSAHLDKVGRFNEGLAEIKRAQQLDPTSLPVNTAVGMPLYFARRYDDAIEEFKKAIDMDPYHAPAHTRLGMTYAQKGMYEEAIVELKQARALDDSKQRKGRFAYLAYVYAVSGRRAEAQEMLAELNKLSKLKHVSPQNFAIIYTGLGEKDQAFAWLHKAYEMGERNDFLKVDPIFDSLRSDPRFNDLLRRMNLAPSNR